MDAEDQGKREAGQDDWDDQSDTSCEYCGAGTHKDVVKAAFWGERGLVAIEDIPARVCEQCGEQFYDEETFRKIERLIADPNAKAKRELVVPLFSLREVNLAE